MRLSSKIAASFSVAVTIVEQVANVLAQPGHVSALVALCGGKIAANARTQALGFSDVDDRALPVVKEVAARFRRQRVELFQNLGGRGFGPGTPQVALVLRSSAALP